MKKYAVMVWVMGGVGCVASGEGDPILAAECESWGGAYSRDDQGAHHCVQRRSPIEENGTGGDDALSCPAGFDYERTTPSQVACSDRPLEPAGSPPGLDVFDPTTARIVVTDQERAWSDVQEERDCQTRVADHELYRGRVTAVSGLHVGLAFEKCQQVPPFKELTYWLLRSPTRDVEEPELAELDVLASGTWGPEKARLSVEAFSPWEGDTITEQMCGEERFVMFVTDGSDRPGVRAWFANRALKLKLACGL